MRLLQLSKSSLNEDWTRGKPLASIIPYNFEEVKDEKDFNLLFRFSILFFVFSFDKICPVIVDVKRIETQTFLRRETALPNEGARQKNLKPNQAPPPAGAFLFGLHFFF